MRRFLIILIFGAICHTANAQLKLVTKNKITRIQADSATMYDVLSTLARHYNYELILNVPKKWLMEYCDNIGMPLYDIATDMNTFKTIYSDIFKMGYEIKGKRFIIKKQYFVNEQ